MHNPEVQIMFYGKDIAQYQVATTNSVVITNVKRTENPNYLLLPSIQNISATTIDILFKKNDKVALHKNIP
jgi:hypothetical protein